MSFFLPIFKELSDKRISYVTVGGIAVVLHGFPRITGDIDLILDLQDQNCKACMTLLDQMGFKPKVPVKPIDFADPILRKEWIEEKGMRAFSLYRQTPMHLEVDILVRRQEDFAGLFARSKIVPVSGVEIRIASIDDLIALKLEAGRGKDLEDIQALRLIQGHVKD